MLKTLFILIWLLLVIPSVAAQTVACPSQDLRYCFRCIGTEVTYQCCAGETPTGYQCLKTNCAEPTEAECAEYVNPWKTKATEAEAKAAEWQGKATHANGQLYSEHWKACFTWGFQMWEALQKVLQGK